MLENHEMEKKLVRLSQPPKGVDVKKVQDVSQAKLFTKSARKRESSGESKKPNTGQKYKHYDKRPVSRRNGNNGGTAFSQLEDQFEELGVGTSKSKKRNVNHLLNFRCKPRDNPFQHGESSLPLSRVVYNAMTTQKHKYNKEQFLQASCQFVVRSKEDYSLQLADPDILVDWDLIEQLRVLSPEGINCPICLYPPVAAKMTRCGHIYCWTCMLHYLSLTDNAWQKCPICFESIYQDDLKSVHIIERKPISVGDQLTFQLMKREKGSTIAIPVSEVDSENANRFPEVNESKHRTVYSKLLLADSQHVLNIVEEEENQLHAQLLEYEYCPEYCFVEKSIDLLKRRKDNLLTDLTKISSEPAVSVQSKPESIVDAQLDSNSTNLLNLEPVNKKISYISAFDDLKVSDDCGEIEGTVENELGEHDESNTIFTTSRERQRYESVSSNGEDLLNSPINPEDLELPTSTTPSFTPKEFFFYQADDGQQIFMHSLNARMLVMTYGGLDRAPAKIQGTVLEKEAGSMTDELRKRLRYLEHLPITSVFEVVEIAMHPPLITDETEAFFIAQVEKRCRRRYRRAKEEKRIENKVKEIEQITYGRHLPPPTRLYLDSLQDFPECGSDTPPNMSPKNRSAQSSRSSSPQKSNSPVTVTHSTPLQTSNTFAQKLKNSNSGISSNGVWNKRSRAVDNNEHQQPSTGCNLSEAVEAALLKANLEKNDGNQCGQGKKKKKKPKPIPLCSVGMVYSPR